MSGNSDANVEQFVGRRVVVTLRDGRTLRGALFGDYDQQRNAYCWNVQDIRVTPTTSDYQTFGKFYAEDVLDIK